MSSADNNSRPSQLNTAQVKTAMSPAGGSGRQIAAGPEPPVIEERNFVYKENTLHFNGYARLPTEKILELVEENSETNLPRDLVEAQLRLYGEYVPWIAQSQPPSSTSSGTLLPLEAAARSHPRSRRWKRKMSDKYKAAMEKYERDLAAWEKEQQAARGEKETSKQEAQVDVPMKDVSLGQSSRK